MRGFLVAAVVCLALAGCAAKKPVATGRVVADDGTIVVKAEDTKALIGTWEGTFTLDDGFEGTTTMTIVSAAPGSVQAYFEFRWMPDGYDRYPSGKNVTTGYVAYRGALHVGAWDMWLSHKDRTYQFTAYGDVGGKPGVLRWSRADTPRLSGT